MLVVSANRLAMNANHLTRDDKKNKYYIKALLTLHGINLAEISRQLNVSLAFVSQVVSGERKGVKRSGMLVRQAVADAVGKNVDELWPKKAA